VSLVKLLTAGKKGDFSLTPFKRINNGIFFPTKWDMRFYQDKNSSLQQQKIEFSCSILTLSSVAKSFLEAQLQLLLVTEVNWMPNFFTRELDEPCRYYILLSCCSW
jgi:hypothetical protein